MGIVYRRVGFTRMEMTQVAILVMTIMMVMMVQIQGIPGHRAARAAAQDGQEARHEEARSGHQPREEAWGAKPGPPISPGDFRSARTCRRSPRCKSKPSLHPLHLQAANPSSAPAGASKYVPVQKADSMRKFHT